MSLKTYRTKRNFSHTPEPAGAEPEKEEHLRFVVQKHHASHLHYDLRLENEGVLKSWAVPKGPTLFSSERRLAMQVEDHPLDYQDFEGVIPAGNYGAGKVIVWDRGSYYVNKAISRKENDREISRELYKGHLDIYLEGNKLRGWFSLIKLGRKPDDNRWFLIKKKDEYADRAIEDESSVKSGLSLNDIDRRIEHVINKDILKTIDFSGARPSPMPGLFKPMLATLADQAFDNPDWLFEVKWDGYRAITRVQNNEVNIYSRSLKSFNSVYTPLVDGFKDYPFDAIFDGEIIIPDEKGISSFQLLQDYQMTGGGPLMYYLFDLMYFNGYDLRDLPLFRRKDILRKVLPQSEVIQLSDDVPGKGMTFFEEIAGAGLEGIIAKKRTSRYKAGSRSSEWLKIKTEKRQEAVIGGFTESRGSRSYFGALVLGVYENNVLTYIGHTGGGFTEDMLKDAYKRLAPLKTDKCPFGIVPKTNMPVTWIRPELVCEVKFREWTNEGHMRQPVFIAFREDKPAVEVRREEKYGRDGIFPPLQGNGVSNMGGDAQGGETPPLQQRKYGLAGQALNTKAELTNLEKVFWPEEGYTKGDVIRFYQDISEIILPYLKDRPQSLNRHPNGITGESFFQKNADQSVPSWVRVVPISSESHGRINYIICDNKDVLAYLNNLGCIEINVWTSRVQYLQKPDFMVFDLDPVETPFSNVVKVALSVRRLLEELMIPGYIKTTGGKGLHIYVPLKHQYTYDQVKDFSLLLCSLVHEREPSLTSLERSPSKRKGQVYLDYMQNHYSATMASPYSIRPRPGAKVSAPLEWNEVNEGLDPSQFNIRTMLQRIERKGDIWKGIMDDRVSIEDVLEKIK